MVDASMLPAIKEALKQNEIGDESPYMLDFACYGESGASFGVFQGDVNVDPLASTALRNILQAGNVTGTAFDTIMSQLCRPLPDGNPLSESDTDRVNACLSSVVGKAIVDAMDDKILQVVLAEVDTCISAAAKKNLTLAPIVLLYVALWVNMTGTPSTLNKWLSGIPEMGLAPPTGPVVTQQDILQYLKVTVYFRLHPRNIVHLEESVQDAVHLLPAK